MRRVPKVSNDKSLIDVPAYRANPMKMPRKTSRVGGSGASGDDWVLLMEVWRRIEERFSGVNGWQMDQRLERVVKLIDAEYRGPS